MPELTWESDRFRIVETVAGPVLEKSEKDSLGAKAWVAVTGSDLVDYSYKFHENFKHLLRDLSTGFKERKA